MTENSPAAVHKDGVTLKIRVIPKTGTIGPRGVSDGHLKWGVSSVPEDGKANKELIVAISKLLKIPKSEIEILSGESSRNKVLLLRGQSSERISDLLEALGLQSL